MRPSPGDYVIRRVEACPPAWQFHLVLANGKQTPVDGAGSANWYWVKREAARLSREDGVCVYERIGRAYRLMEGQTALFA